MLAVKQCFSMLVLLAAFATGCTTKAKARAQAAAAFAAGQQWQAAQTPHVPVVRVIGEVRNSLVEWSEGLTLARAIVAAEYTAPAAPIAITITRNGEIIRVNPGHLLQGRVDPELQAGDVVEIRR